MDSLDFNYSSVAHYERQHSLNTTDLNPDVTVETVYNVGPMNEEFQAVNYEFDSIVGGLERFRETIELEINGDRIYPVVADFRGHSSMTLLLPIEDRVDAVDFAEKVLEDLESFYSQYRGDENSF